MKKSRLCIACWDVRGIFEKSFLGSSGSSCLVVRVNKVGFTYITILGRFSNFRFKVGFARLQIDGQEGVEARAGSSETLLRENRKFCKISGMGHVLGL